MKNYKKQYLVLWCRDKSSRDNSSAKSWYTKKRIYSNIIKIMIFLKNSFNFTTMKNNVKNE